jgi:hypothetical protein
VFALFFGSVQGAWVMAWGVVGFTATGAVSSVGWTGVGHGADAAGGEGI